MTYKPSDSPDCEDPARLFEEYLSAFDAGNAPDLDDLYRRAGARAEELRKRIEVFKALQELSDTIQPLPADAAQEDLGALADMKELGRFTNLVKLAVTRLSAVFLAEDKELQRLVALKVLLRQHVPIVDARNWMRSEGVSLARLDHPGIVRIYDLGEANGLAYVAMEYVPGPRLDDVIAGLKQRKAGADASALTIGVAPSVQHLESIHARCRLALELARALEYCHAQNVVHRDVKPGNVLLDAQHHPKLIDFGLAHLGAEQSLTQLTEQFMGTAAYIAPEQVDNQRTGASALADQFAFGVVLYELLTGVNPFQKGTLDVTLRAISRAEPPPLRAHLPTIPADLERICLHCLERRAEDRYPSMRELAADLEAFLELRAISLLPPTPWKLASLWAKRNARELAIAGSVLGVLLVAWIGTWLVGARRAHAEFATDLARWTNGVAALLSPDDFNAMYRDAGDRRNQARDLDRGVYGRLFAGSCAADLQALFVAMSRRLHEVIAQERGDPTKLAVHERRFVDRDIRDRWANALGLDSAYAPESDANEVDRHRGKVVVVDPPETVQLNLWRYGEMDMQGESALAPYDKRRGLTRGLYRAEWRTSAGELLRETEFQVRPEEPRWTLELRPLNASIRAALVHVPEMRVVVRPGKETVVPAFYVMARPVQWSDIGRDSQIPAAEMERQRAIARHMLKREQGDSDPAVLPRLQIDRVALDLGARLPTLPEYLAAEAHGSIAAGAMAAVASGEAISKPPDESGGYSISYEPSVDVHKRLSATFEDRLLYDPETKRAVVFRLAITDLPK